MSTHWTLRILEGAAVIAVGYGMYELGKYVGKNVAEVTPQLADKASDIVQPSESWHPDISGETPIAKYVPPKQAAKAQVPIILPVMVTGGKASSDTSEASILSWLTRPQETRDTSPRHWFESQADYIQRIYAPNNVHFDPVER